MLKNLNGQEIFLENCNWNYIFRNYILWWNKYI